MATDVVVPEVGETGMDVTLVRWCKAAGDAVAVGDILFELDTDKTVVEVEAWTAGTLIDLRVGPGDVVSPHQVIATLLAPGESASSGPGGLTPGSADPSGSGTASMGQSRSAGGPPMGSLSSVASGGTPAEPAPGGVPADGVGASPRARRLARERGLDLTTVPGTGLDGLITERDVLAALADDPEDA